MLNLQEELSRLRTSLSSVENHISNASDTEHATVSFVTRGFQTEPITEPVSHSNNITPAPMENGFDEARGTVGCESPGSADYEVTLLRSQLAQKDRDMHELEQKYRGYLWKAREVIRVLEREQRQMRDGIKGGELTDSTEASKQEIERLRGLLVEKEDIIEKLEVSLCPFVVVFWTIFAFFCLRPKSSCSFRLSDQLFLVINLWLIQVP